MDNVLVNHQFFTFLSLISERRQIMVRDYLGAITAILCAIPLFLLFRGNRTEKTVKVQIGCCLVACALNIITAQFFSVSLGDYVSSIFTAASAFVLAMLYYRQLKSGLF